MFKGICESHAMKVRNKRYFFAGGDNSNFKIEINYLIKTIIYAECTQKKDHYILKKKFSN